MMTQLRTVRRVFVLGLAAIALAGLVRAGATAQEQAVRIPPPAAALNSDADGKSDVAVLAGGCFWGVQAVFQHVDGVTAAISGYAGGPQAAAHYEDVGRGDTGHAEAVRITFDPRRITYGQLLQVFFSVAHDPTERDRQGPDVGPQYRSAIFPTNAAQEKLAREYIAQLDRAHLFQRPIATTIERDRAFFPAEPYHQDFLARNPRHPYIVVNDLPKLDELRRVFPDRYRQAPALVGGW